MPFFRNTQSVRVLSSTNLIENLFSRVREIGTGETLGRLALWAAPERRWRTQRTFRKIWFAPCWCSWPPFALDAKMDRGATVDDAEKSA